VTRDDPPTLGQAESATGLREPEPAPRALPPGGSPGIAERPEVLAGAAFAGAFVAARILKRIFD
jgi:hypothetical protein